MLLLSLRLWIGQRLFGTVGYPDAPVGVRVSPWRFIKWPCEEPELEGHRYVAANTSIPVPRLYRIYQYHGNLALEMEFLQDCETLHSGWRKLSAEQKCMIVDKMSGYIKQLRELSPPVQHQRRISSTNGGPCRDIRVGTRRPFGPFEDGAAFHECIRGGILEAYGETVFGTDVMRVHKRARDYDVCFTHGDLGVQNILIRKGDIVGIIDWECAGWYPEYWEYTKAHYNSVLVPEFYQMLAQRVDRYDEELKAERSLWRQMDQPLDVV